MKPARPFTRDHAVLFAYAALALACHLIGLLGAL